MFTEHTLESAPAASRRAMESTVRHVGHLPQAVARLASSPHLLNGFLKLSAMFEQTTLDPVAREVVVMTVATRNECHVCVAMHAGKLRALGAREELIAALSERKPLDDVRLEAIRQFTLEVLRTAGGVGDEELRGFLAHGYTEQNALEVVMGIGTYTMSTLANRLTRA
ncbi:carboxymuconolactone decarboxylase family protein [Streptomyces lunaelactis]|uniref:carboxymuconolactone decarboxylase family protein n=1 Tax=Streptomyces lunaelactis TaxID=1535768 RepID=UPI0015849B00|nr:carboxymuconolactone decarboxylase family protein [Streptomyces lunaelactis]NUL07809.1 carboxymuconolactone decarboxylase family protein [Streptomyces lunaelactis]